MRRVLQGVGIAGALLACGAAQAQTVRLFAYDSSRPLQVREAGSTASNGVRVVELSYASPKGGRVPATLVVPAAEGRYPAVVFQHGAGDADRSDFLAEAEDLAHAGLASLLVDAPFNRPPYRPWLTFRERDRAAYVQNVIDLRRAIDLLQERPEIDGARLALAGFSYGGVLAGIVAGVERRLDAVVVMSGPGRVTDALREEGRRLGVAPKRLRRYLAYMRFVDAVGYVGRATAPILFQFGRQDSMPAAWFRKYVDAAGPDKRVQWYPAGHGLDASATRDRKAWLLQRLRASSRALAGSVRWERIEPGGRTACARGGRYAFWLRRADPKRVVVFFQGGGGCFDVRSCAPGSTWFDDRVDEFDDPAFDGGILAVDDPRNPFRDWSFVFIPSCTGDVHLGDRIARYGQTVIRHRGWRNARAALAGAFGAFPDPEAVLVAGCSAGSVGSAFHAPAVIERWPRARVTQLGDSLAFVFHRPIRLVDWGAHRRFPAFFRIGSRRFTMVEYLRALARRYPGRTFARFNYASDDVQERFYAAVGADPAGFEPRLRRAEEELKRLPNYRSYLACGGDHCVLPQDSFFSLRMDGVAIRSWAQRLAAGRDVGCPTCP